MQAADASGVADPPTTVEAALESLFAGAGIVFAGEVLSVSPEAGAVTIRWQVQDAVRGVSPGEYVLREWAGLWAGDSARYVVGERALVLLHASSLAGFASPVGGLDGVIPLRGDAGGSLLDLRWLAQRVVVADTARLQPLRALRAAGGSLEVANALQVRSATMAKSAGVVTESISLAGTATVPTSYAQVDGAVVLGMLHAWQRASGGAH